MDYEPFANGQRICPVCKVSPIEWLFINFQEKLLMCINPHCDYPFGQVDLQIIKVVNDEEENEESDTDSVSSSSESISTLPESYRRLIADHNDLRNRQIKIREELRDIEKSCKEIHNMKKEDLLRVNQVYLTKMKEIYEMAGRQMLKPEGVEILTQREADSTTEELKININPVLNESGTINIECNETGEISNEENQINVESLEADEGAATNEEKINLQGDSINQAKFEGAAGSSVKSKVETSAAGSATEDYEFFEKSFREIHNMKKKDILRVNQVQIYLNKMKEIHEIAGKQMFKPEAKEIPTQGEADSTTEDLNTNINTVPDESGTNNIDIPNIDSNETGEILNGKSQNNLDTLEVANNGGQATNNENINLQGQSTNQAEFEGAAGSSVKSKVETSAAAFASQDYESIEKDKEEQIASENNNVPSDKEKTRKKQSSKKNKNYYAKNKKNKRSSK